MSARQNMRLGISGPKRKRASTSNGSKRRKTGDIVDGNSGMDIVTPSHQTSNLTTQNLPKRFTFFDDVIMAKRTDLRVFYNLRRFNMDFIVYIMANILSFLGLRDAILLLQDNEMSNPIAPMLRTMIVRNPTEKISIIVDGEKEERKQIKLEQPVVDMLNKAHVGLDFYRGVLESFTPRLENMLNRDRKKWDDWANMSASLDPDESQTIRNEGAINHYHFADAQFANYLTEAVTWNSFLSIQLLSDVQKKYSQEREWKDWRQTRWFDSKFRQSIDKAIMGGLWLDKEGKEIILPGVIELDNLAMFQWLLELDPPFNEEWVTKSIRMKRKTFIDHLLFKQTFKPKSHHTRTAPDVDMVDFLVSRRFPLSSLMMENAIIKERHDLFIFLLEKKVKAPACPGLYLRRAIDYNRLDMIVSLKEYGYDCSVELMIHALCPPLINECLDKNCTKPRREKIYEMLRHRIKTVQHLYRTFYADKQMVFESATEHESFLGSFLWQLTIESTILGGKIPDVDPNKYPFFLTNVLKWMNEHRWNDLSYSLLQLTAIRKQSLNELDIVLGYPFPAPTMNHMDEAILQSSDLIYDRLLDHGVSCSHLGFLKLVTLANSEERYGERVKRLAQHHVCRDAVRLQEVLPRIRDKTVHKFCLERRDQSDQETNVEILNEMDKNEETVQMEIV